MMTVPFGRAKGVAINEAADNDLQWIRKAILEKLEADPDKPFADKDRQFIAEVDTELKARAGGASPTTATTRRQPAKVANLAKPVPQTLAMGKAIHDPKAVNAQLQKLSESYHLVTPVTHVDSLPPGCGVATSFVVINPDTSKDGPGEVYPVGGGVGLSGTTLARIASAYGIDWDPHLSRRLDNGLDPHYCHFRAVCRVRNFDGTIRTVPGEVEIDARDGSPQIDEIIAKAKKGNRDPASQILELRKFLLRHAESKAQNRAIAKAAGIKRSYKPDELKKPFAVARLMWTGESDDPQLKRVFAEKTADAMIGSTMALYGRPAEPARQLTGHAPPPIGAAVESVGDFGGYDADADGEEYQSDPNATYGEDERY